MQKYSRTATRPWRMIVPSENGDDVIGIIISNERFVMCKRGKLYELIIVRGLRIITPTVSNRYGATGELRIRARNAICAIKNASKRKNTRRSREITLLLKACQTIFPNRCGKDMVFIYENRGAIPGSQISVIAVKNLRTGSGCQFLALSSMC